MKAGEIYYLISNPNIGIKLEAYEGNKLWSIQWVDIINKKAVISRIFEKATVNKINKLFNYFNPSKEKYNV
jgi:hypothetical protein